MGDDGDFGPDEVLANADEKYMQPKLPHR